jgi:DNA-directed RNA polymerase specialized sigma subunit
MKRLSKKNLITQKVINLLTDNEDHRQDLWVYYLSGAQYQSFPDFLNKKQHLDTEKTIISQIWDFMNQNNPKLLELLQDLPDESRSVVLLLLLDNDTPAISRYKGISQVRVQRIINRVGKKVQETTWPSKSTLQTMKSLV